MYMYFSLLFCARVRVGAVRYTKVENKVTMCHSQGEMQETGTAYYGLSLGSL